MGIHGRHMEARTFHRGREHVALCPMFAVTLSASSPNGDASAHGKTPFCDED